MNRDGQRMKGFIFILLIVWNWETERTKWSLPISWYLEKLNQVFRKSSSNLPKVENLTFFPLSCQNDVYKTRRIYKLFVKKYKNKPCNKKEAKTSQDIFTSFVSWDQFEMDSSWPFHGYIKAAGCVNIQF